MSDHAVMPYQHYKDACDAIRAKGAGSASIKSGDMAAAINAISGGTVSLPDISFTHLHDCPALDKKNDDYFGENVRTYLTDHLSQSGDLLLTVMTYVGPTTMQLVVPSVNAWTVNGHNGGVTILAAVSIPEMVQFFKDKPVKDLGFELDNDLNFFRIRGVPTFSSVVAASGRIRSGSQFIFSSDVTVVPRSAVFGVAFSSKNTTMLTCSTNNANGDIFKHVFSTIEFDSHGQHMTGAFFGAIKQSKTVTNDVLRLTITNSGSGDYTYVKTGVFY